MNLLLCCLHVDFHSSTVKGGNLAAAEAKATTAGAPSLFKWPLKMLAALKKVVKTAGSSYDVMRYTQPQRQQHHEQSSSR